MKIALLVHGWPFEQRGGTELQTRRLAHELVRRGHEVLVIAGTLELSDPPSQRRVRELVPGCPASFPVVFVEREDLYFDHWQKHACPRSARTILALLKEHGSEVLHVQHWLRSSSDIIRRAARRGIPSLVSLHDHATTCLLNWRVRPGETSACAQSFEPLACARCAKAVPPRTPWVPLEQAAILAAERCEALAAEVRAACFCLVPSMAHGEHLLRHGLKAGSMMALPPLLPVELSPRPPLPAPRLGEPLRVGAWGLSDPAKGSALLRAAAERLGGRVELVLAGLCAGESAPLVEVHGPYTPEELQDHPVSRVHVAASGSLALESFGLTASEGLCLGLPLVLPLAGAAMERFSEGQGVLFYTQGDPADLARVLDRLATEQGLLARLRGSLPRPMEDTQGTVDQLLEFYSQAIRRGPPEVPPAAWYEERMQEAWLQTFDEEVRKRRPEDLGFRSQS